MSKCSFCKRIKKDDEFEIGEYGRICKDCVRVSNKYLKKGGSVPQKKEDCKVKTLKPFEIKNGLDRHVIGQDEAKKVLSVEICNHLKRISNKDVIFKKSNILLIGPTGSGKTLILETLASLIEVPLVITDATTFTEAGYVGKDVYGCLTQLLDKSGHDIKKAETGIIYIDEADKMVIRKSDGKNTRDIRGEGVQQAFLKMIEGAEIEIEVASSAGLMNKLMINTKNILFIFGGTFDGIGDVVAERLNKVQVKPLVDINDGNSTILSNHKCLVESRDVIKYGFIKEFVGRVPLIVTLKRLTTEQLMSVLTETEQSIVMEYQNLFGYDGIKINFENDALLYVIEEAAKNDVGARGIRGVMSKCLNQLMYDISQQDKDEVIVTREVLEFYNGCR